MGEDIGTAKDGLHLSTGACLSPDPIVHPYVDKKEKRIWPYSRGAILIFFFSFHPCCIQKY